MKDNNKFIIIPKLESKHINIIIFLIATTIRYVIPKLIKYFAADNHPKDYYKETCYFDMLSNFVADISTGIYKLITIFSGKDKKKDITTIGVQTKKEIIKKALLIIPLIALIDISAQLCLYGFSYCDKKGEILVGGKKYEDKYIHERDLFFVVGIDIFFRYIFCSIILKSNFYKHHYLSMILTGLGFIPLFIINFVDIFKNNSNRETKTKVYIYIYLGLYIIRAILYSLEDVFNKVALNKLLFRPYELMFYKAVFQIIPLIGISIFAINDGNFYDYYQNNINDLTGEIFYRFFFIICTIFRTIALITIIEQLNPSHLSILKSLEFIFFSIILTIWNKIIFEYWTFINFIIELICCLILFLGAAIHNEMIIINKKGFLECTDYYKTEIKPFDNDDVAKDENKNEKMEDSLLGSSINN